MPTEDMTFYAVFEEEKQPEKKPEVGIKNYFNSRTVDYRTTITFTATADNMQEDTTIIWYKDGQRAGILLLIISNKNQTMQDETDPNIILQNKKIKIFKLFSSQSKQHISL